MIFKFPNNIIHPISDNFRRKHKLFSKVLLIANRAQNYKPSFKQANIPFLTLNMWISDKK